VRVLILVLSSLLLLLAFTPYALAGDWDDCKLSARPIRQAACDRIIAKGGESAAALAAAYRYRAVTFDRNSEKSKASADLNQAIRLDPKGAAYPRGLILLINGDIDGAIAQFDEALKASPGDAEILNSRGTAYVRKGQNERAIEDYNEAIRIDASHALAWSNRGSVYHRSGKLKEALADINEALRLRPDYANAYYIRGLVHESNKDYDAALTGYNRAIELDPAYADALSQRATLYHRKGDYDRAIADATKAIELNPESPRDYNSRANAYAAKGQFEQALADYKKAIELTPKGSVILVNRAILYQSLGEFDAGIADCDSAIKNNPKHAEAYVQRGFLFARKNDLDRALADGSKAIEVNPKGFGGYNVRAVAYAARGELEKAFAEYNKAIEIEPNQAFLYNNRANAYLAKNDIARAIADYDKAIEADPKYASAYFNRGRAHERRNDKARAVADYRKLLELPAWTKGEAQRQEVARQRIARLTGEQKGAGAGTAQEAPKNRRVALVIGNSNYSNAGALTNPRNDAKAMAASLRRLGFGYVIELHDLSREQMGRALKDFGDRAEGAEWAVVFYAGHGMEMNGVSYLIPTDAEIARDTHVADETISLTQVQAKVDAASKLGLVILDSCRDNPFLSRMARSVGATRSVGNGLANVEPEGNVLVAYSAKHGTTALDGAGANSPFTDALLRFIEEPGLEINFLFRKVRDEVRTKTQRRQEPFLYGSLSSEPLYFKEAAAR
jgi:tetratricopeptide (TPR) repeat protein